MRSSSHLYFSRLDHLRLLAAFLVFYWHAGHWANVYPPSLVPTFFPFSIFEEGHTGVALFMVLSGFVFSAICGNRTPRYGDFIRNRFLRIAPLFTVWTLLIFYTNDVTPERMLATLLGLYNKYSLLGLGWTIVIEFQFYLIFPFLLLFSRRYGARYLVGLLGTMVMLRWLLWNQLGSIQYISYWTILGRIDQFLCGMMGYVIYRRYHRWLSSPLFFLAVVTAWLYIYHVINQNGGYTGQPASTYFQAMWIVVPTLEGMFYMLIAASYLRLRIHIFKWIDGSLAWLGSLSYSLYLNHEAVLGAAFNWVIKYKWPIATPLQISLYSCLVVYPLVVAISAVTYYFIEKPFLSLRRSYLIEPSHTAPESGSQNG